MRGINENLLSIYFFVCLFIRLSVCFTFDSLCRSSNGDDEDVGFFQQLVKCHQLRFYLFGVADGEEVVVDDLADAECFQTSCNTEADPTKAHDTNGAA